MTKLVIKFKADLEALETSDRVCNDWVNNIDQATRLCKENKQKTFRCNYCFDQLSSDETRISGPKRNEKKSFCGRPDLNFPPFKRFFLFAKDIRLVRLTRT